MAGKGDRIRPFDRKKWDEGYERAFKMTLPEFQGFPKIPRFNRNIIITEKIDGTNAQICISKSGRITAGSRKRWLTLDNDNYGFAAWVEEHKEELIVGLGPGRHFGEWWGKGINRNYGLDHRQFSLFNVSRWHRPITLFKGWEHLFPKCQVPPDCCDTVPILYHGLSGSEAIFRAIETLRKMGSFAAPGFLQPEGIVIYHTAGNCFFKVTLKNDDQPKGK